MARQMCQSCGMPIKKEVLKGTEDDGSRSEQYCINCYQRGHFTWPDATAEQMQTYCMGILTHNKHWPSFLAHLATHGIPKLDRWRKA